MTTQTKQQKELETKIVNRINSTLDEYFPQSDESAHAHNMRHKLYQLRETVQSKNVEIAKWGITHRAIWIEYNWLHEEDISLCTYENKKAVKFDWPESFTDHDAFISNLEERSSKQIDIE